MSSTRTIVIGDIHGCRDELQALLDLVAPNADDTIIALGDIVDRGPDSPAVADFFRSTPNARSVRGNHERKHLRWQRGELKPALSQRLAREQFPAEEYSQALAFFEEMPRYIDLPEALLVHGFFEPGVPLEKQRDVVLVGTMTGEQYLTKHHDRPWYELYDGDKPIVVGHLNYLNNGQPLVWKDKVFAIDTGCYKGRRLTALILPELRIVSVPSAGNYWQKARKHYREQQEKMLSPGSPWDKIADFLARQPTSQEQRRRQTELRRECIKGEYALNAICTFVRKENERVMRELRAEQDFAALAYSEQAATYNSKVKNSPVAPLLHQAQCGGLTRKYAKRKLLSPHHAVTVAETLHLDLDRAGLNVFLDDARPAPEGWMHVRRPEEAIELLQTGTVERISLDHDLGNDEHGTGYDVLLWIEEAVAERGFAPPEISIHSANSSACRKMELAIESIRRFEQEQRITEL